MGIVFINELLNLDLFALGITVAAAGILGFVVLYSNYKSATSFYFLLFCFGVIAWSIINYLSYKPYSPEVGIWIVRFVLFISVWFVTALFCLLYIFPEQNKQLPLKIKLTLFTSAGAVSLLTLSPYVFGQILTFNARGIANNIETNWGIVFYAGYSLITVGSAISILVHKIKKAASVDRIKFRPLAYGFGSSFLLLLTFNLVFPAFLHTNQFIPLGPVFLIPFIVGAGYAIIRHHLLNIKIISTQILIFFLAITAIVEVVVANNVFILVFRIFVFLLVLSVGILLIRSVMHEVEQRAKLELLSKELEAANVQLKSLDQARADFITLTSHQLRTPPSTIKWYLAAIKTGDYGELSDGVKEAITKTEITNNALISLIDDLLNASRIERGKMEFLFEPVHVDQLAKFTVEQLIPQASFKKLALTYVPPTLPIPEVLADKEKLRQVINNFIDNAIKYTPKGEIKVQVEVDDTYVSVLVTDSGKGIAPEVIPALFEKYSRGKDSVMHATGIGIGLYVAKVVIENHEGLIGAKSPGVNMGSTFYFKLPIHSKLPQTKIMDLVKEQQNNPHAHT